MKLTNFSPDLIPSTASELLILQTQPWGCRSFLQIPSAGVLGHSKMPQQMAHNEPKSVSFHTSHPRAHPVISVGGTCLHGLPSPEILPLQLEQVEAFSAPS